MASRNETPRIRRGGADSDSAAERRAGAPSRRSAASRRAETCGWRAYVRARSVEAKRRDEASRDGRRQRNARTTADGGFFRARVWIFGSGFVFGSARRAKHRFAKVRTGKTRGAERARRRDRAPHVRRLGASDARDANLDRSRARALRTSGNGGGSVHLVAGLASSAAAGLVRTFNATRRRRDARDSSNAPAPGTTREAKDSAPMTGIGIRARRQNLEASEFERFAEVVERPDGGGVRNRTRERSRRVKRGWRASAARSSTAGDSGDARHARRHERGNGIFLALLGKGISFFSDWRSIARVRACRQTTSGRRHDSEPRRFFSCARAFGCVRNVSVKKAFARRSDASVVARAARGGSPLRFLTPPATWRPLLSPAASPASPRASRWSSPCSGSCPTRRARCGR